MPPYLHVVSSFVLDDGRRREVLVAEDDLFDDVEPISQVSRFRRCRRCERWPCFCPKAHRASKHKSAVQVVSSQREFLLRCLSSLSLHPLQLTHTKTHFSNPFLSSPHLHAGISNASTILR